MLLISFTPTSLPLSRKTKTTSIEAKYQHFTMDNTTNRNHPATATVAEITTVEPKEPVRHDAVVQDEPKLCFGQWLKWHWLDILTMVSNNEAAHI